MERLRELKEAAGKRERSEGGDGGEAPASALELAGLSNTEVPAPVIVLPKRRKVSDTLAQLRAGGEGSDSDEDEDDDEDLNWRAKKSVA